jgi:hypothetical protein
LSRISPANAIMKTATPRTIPSSTAGRSRKRNTMPIAIASSTTAFPTIMPAPPRRFAQAGCRLMPATKREKMKATRARPMQIASCQPRLAPVWNASTSVAVGSLSRPNQSRVHQPAATRSAATRRLVAGIATPCMNARRRAAGRVVSLAKMLAASPAPSAAVSSFSRASIRSRTCWWKVSRSPIQSGSPAPAYIDATTKAESLARIP